MKVLLFFFIFIPSDGGKRLRREKKGRTVEGKGGEGEEIERIGEKKTEYNNVSQYMEPSQDTRCE